MKGLMQFKLSCSDGILTLKLSFRKLKVIFVAKLSIHRSWYMATNIIYLSCNLLDHNFQLEVCLCVGYWPSRQKYVYLIYKEVPQSVKLSDIINCPLMFLKLYVSTLINCNPCSIYKIEHSFKNSDLISYFWIDLKNHKKSIIAAI